MILLYLMYCITCQSSMVYWFNNMKYSVCTQRYILELKKTWHTDAFWYNNNRNNVLMTVRNLWKSLIIYFNLRHGYKLYCLVNTRVVLEIEWAIIFMYHMICSDHYYLSYGLMSSIGAFITRPSHKLYLCVCVSHFHTHLTIHSLLTDACQKPTTMKCIYYNRMKRCWSDEVVDVYLLNKDHMSLSDVLNWYELNDIAIFDVLYHMSIVNGLLIQHHEI